MSEQRDRRIYTQSEMDGAVAAERERVAVGILGCTACRKIHEPHGGGTDAKGVTHAPSWASLDDGHSYRAAWQVSRNPETLIRRALIGGENLIGGGP